MKAVLVMNMPEYCTECPLIAFEFGTFCSLNEKSIPKPATDRPEWCPLKPMPKKWVAQMNGLDARQQIENWYFQEGWNACLREIEGEGKHNAEE